MKISLTIKMFLAVLAACCAVMLMQAIAMRVGVRHGFFGYLNDQGRQTMEESLPRVKAAFRLHGDWDFLRGPVHRWFDIIRPAPHVMNGGDRAGPPLPPDVAMARQSDSPGPDAMGPSPADLTGAVIRMGLLDEHLNRIAGNPLVDAASMRLPVIVDGRTVGWIAMVPFEQVLQPGEARFLREQLTLLWMIAAISVLFVALFTYVITRRAMRRVRNLAQATRALAAGNYGSRLEPGPRDELGSLAQDFNRMAQTLEHNERARRSFMADISHELRTPLAVIRAELEAIQDGIRPSTPQSLDVMHQEVRLLDKLIGDLHDLSLTDIGAQAYRMVPIAVGMVLRSVAASMRGRFELAGLNLCADIHASPLLVLGDESRLQQLFGNLLENALRYTDAGGEVRIDCMPRADAVHIRVSDSAPGVAPDKLEQLFERFYRADASRNRASGGSGLGLAICRNIVEAHGGLIHAAPSPLGGLAFTITLPLAT